MLVQDVAHTRHEAHTTAAHEVIRLTDVNQLGSRIDEWRELAARIEGSSYFQTPDWVLTWWEDAGRPPAEIAFWRNTAGTLEAVAYLAATRERLIRSLPIMVQITVNLGSGRPHSADHCGWPVLPHRVVDVQRWVSTHHWRNTVELRHLDRETGVPCVPPGAKRVLTTPCPRLYVENGSEQLRRSKNLRKHIARYQRKLTDLGVSFTWTPPEAVTKDHVDMLFTLSESRRSLKGFSSFTRERFLDFHRRLVSWSGRGYGVAMAVASCNGRPIGVNYGFVWRDTYYNYQGGWDAAWADLSLGTVLESETIRLAGLQGFHCIDYLRGREQYKYRFGATDKLDESWIVPRGASGWLIAMKYRAVHLQRAWREVRGRGARHRTRASSASALDA